jgi:hypothetical protein
MSWVNLYGKFCLLRDQVDVEQFLIEEWHLASYLSALHRSPHGISETAATYLHEMTGSVPGNCGYCGDGFARKFPG